MLQRDTHGNVTRTGIAIDIDRLASWTSSFAEHGDLYANNDNGRSGRATEVLFNGPTGQAFFQWWHDMVEEDLAMNVGRNPTYADTFLTLGAGRVGMAIGSSAALRSVVDALEGGLAQTEVDLGVAHLPGVPGGTGLPGIYGRALWILKSHPQEEQEAAWKFIKWLMEPEQQAEWYAGSGYLPVNLKAFELAGGRRDRDEVPAVQGRRSALPGGRLLARAGLGALLGPYLDIVDIVMRAVEEMLVGDKDPIDAINDAAEESNRDHRRVQPARRVAVPSWGTIARAGEA